MRCAIPPGAARGYRGPGPAAGMRSGVSGRRAPAEPPVGAIRAAGPAEAGTETGSTAHAQRGGGCGRPERAPALERPRGQPVLRHPPAPRWGSGGLGEPGGECEPDTAPSPRPLPARPGPSRARRASPPRLHRGQGFCSISRPQGLKELRARKAGEGGGSAPRF